MRKLIYMILVAGLFQLAAQTNPKTFATPEEAREALVQAVANGLDSIRAFFGPGSADTIHTGDPVEDKKILDRFIERTTEKTRLEPDPVRADLVTVLIGNDEYPLAVPLKEKNGRWFFDLQEGKAEIRRRTIGNNELDAIEICRGYVEAQEQYAQTDWNGNAIREYAKKIVSTAGKKDGLYWPGDDSPVAAGIAKAFAEGYAVPGGKPQPYHGYYFKVLLTQGPSANGGARDYVVHGLMIGGFALVAWPAEYGASGIMTFTVNQDGVVFEKNLGPQTSALAKALSKFNPDDSWRVAKAGVEEP